MHSIYFDFNSTAPLLPEVAAAMADADAAGFANPASQHALGRRAHQVLEDTREELARLLGADLAAGDRLIFTSGGTEANNLAVLGLTGATSGLPSSADKDCRIIISAIEHPSVVAAADHLASRGWHVDKLRVDSNGVISLRHLDELLSGDSPASRARLVSVMLANNETGVIQPIVEIVARCAGAGVPFHTDAVQAVGKIPVDFRALGVAAMSVAPHKFGGPRGIGALVVRQGVELRPVLHGATQQFGLRPGTESISLPIGFLTALRAWKSHRDQWSAEMEAVRDRLEAGIHDIYPHAVINGATAPRLPHTSNIAFVGRDRQALFMALDLAGVCCSTGSACASGSSEPSPTLMGMGLPREVVESSLRFSLGPTTTADEIDEVLRRLKSVIKSG
jgi:cysteine desulfurase